MVARQVTGDWQTNEQDLPEFRTAYGTLVEEFETFEIQHIPREENKEADALVEQAFDN